MAILRRLSGFFRRRSHGSRVRQLERYNEELRRMQRRLEAKNAEVEAKNAELQRFAYAVSHDLRSPLITINGFLGYLARDAASGDIERLEADLAKVREAVSVMSGLLDELLRLSRIGSVGNTLMDVDLGELARQATEIVAGQIAERGVEVIVHPGLPSAVCDRSRLLGVLQNLIENAVKYMGDQKEPRLEIGTEHREGEKHLIYVRDNGMGIDPAYHDRVFGLFRQLDSSTAGTGMGLTMVRRIIEVHGGRIWVESEGRGKGSTFYFTLPRTHGTHEKRSET